MLVYEYMEELRKSLDWNIQDFIKYYIELTENWLCLGTAAHELNVALGVVTMVNEVDIIGANVAQKTNHSKPR